MTKLYLVRHGQTESNACGIYQGQTNSPLSSLGHKQAQLLAKEIVHQELVIDKLYSSPAGRAQQTAEYVSNAIGKEVILDSGLQEINLGNWEGYTWEQICEDYPDASCTYHENWWTFDGHGGESWLDAQLRFYKTILRLSELNPGKNLMFVAHGGVIRTLISKILGSSNPRLPLDIDNASLTELRVTNDSIRVVSVNNHFYLKT